MSNGVSIQNDGFVNARGKVRIKPIPRNMLIAAARQAEFVGFSFHQNSVVGCGLDLANSRAVFVVNGKTLDLSAAQEVLAEASCLSS